MKLFAIYIGGEHDRANIEIHDMRFVAAESIEATFGELRSQWWGKPKSLHVDCWAELTEVDGHAVTLKPEPFSGPECLYYVNVGGYDRSEFIEKHKNVFVVAKSPPEARKRAIAQVKHWYAPHRDEQYEAEQVFGLAASVSPQRLHIHLERKTDTAKGELKFVCEYRPIALRKTA